MIDETDDQSYVRELLKSQGPPTERDQKALAALGIVPPNPPDPDATPDFDGGPREPANESVDPHADHNQTIYSLVEQLRQERFGA